MANLTKSFPSSLLSSLHNHYLILPSLFSRFLPLSLTVVSGAGAADDGGWAAPRHSKAVVEAAVVRRLGARQN